MAVEATDHPAVLKLVDVSRDTINEIVTFPDDWDLTTCTSPVAPIKLRPTDDDGDALDSFTVTLAPTGYADNQLRIYLATADVLNLPVRKRLYSRLTWTMANGDTDTPLFIDLQLRAA